jgi:hypothetical protein
MSPQQNDVGLEPPGVSVFRDQLGHGGVGLAIIGRVDQFCPEHQAQVAGREATHPERDPGHEQQSRPSVGRA